MKKYKLFLIVFNCFVLTRCNYDNTTKENFVKADSSHLNFIEQSGKDNSQEKTGFLSLSDLEKLVTIDNLNKETIVAFLKNHDEHWQYEGTDEKGIYVSKNNDERSKGIITYFLKYHAIEYMIFSKNQFFNISGDIKNGNYSLIKSNKNKYGGEIITYHSDNFGIVMEEIPLTTPGESGFKVLIAQKR